MKITKTQLKQIIKEELSTLSEHGDWFDEENETRADKKFRDSQEASRPVDPDPQQAMEDIYFESEFLRMVKEDFLTGYLSPRQDEIVEGLKRVISDYLRGLEGE